MKLDSGISMARATPSLAQNPVSEEQGCGEEILPSLDQVPSNDEGEAPMTPTDVPGPQDHVPPRHVPRPPDQESPSAEGGTPTPPNYMPPSAEESIPTPPNFMLPSAEESVPRPPDQVPPSAEGDVPTPLDQMPPSAEGNVPGRLPDQVPPSAEGDFSMPNTEGELSPYMKGRDGHQSRLVYFAF